MSEEKEIYVHIVHDWASAPRFLPGDEVEVVPLSRGEKAEWEAWYLCDIDHHMVFVRQDELEEYEQMAENFTVLGWVLDMKPNLDLS